jgi:hypothetical protein
MWLYKAKANKKGQFELVKHHNEDFKKRIGIDYTFSTYRSMIFIQRS